MMRNYSFDFLIQSPEHFYFLRVCSTHAPPEPSSTISQLGPSRSQGYRCVRSFQFYFCETDINEIQVSRASDTSEAPFVSITEIIESKRNGFGMPLEALPLSGDLAAVDLDIVDFGH